LSYNSIEAEGTSSRSNKREPLNVLRGHSDFLTEFN